MTYPTIRPALTLEFEKSKKLDPRITFTRSSTATYLDAATGLIKTAPDGVARFEKEGLLIEESRTNSLTYSVEFDNAAWTKTNTTITANTVASPDGTITAEKLASSTGTWPTFIHQTFSGSGNRTLSVFAKADNSSWLAMGGIGAAGELAYFNLSTGTVGTQQANVIDAVIREISNGWYYCSVTCNFQSYGGFVPVSGDNTLNIASTGQGIYIWGAQLEAGSFPTSYIPTSGSTATRAADVVSISNAEMLKVVNPSGNACFMTTHWSTSGANQERFFLDSTGYLEAKQWRSNKMRGNGIPANPTAYTPITGQETYNTVFESRDGNTVSMGNNAGSYSSGTWTQTLPGNGVFQFGYASGYQRKQVISRILYYPQPLTQAELEATSEAMT